MELAAVGLQQLVVQRSGHSRNGAMALKIALLVSSTVAAVAITLKEAQAALEGNKMKNNNGARCSRLRCGTQSLNGLGGHPTSPLNVR